VTVLVSAGLGVWSGCMEGGDRVMNVWECQWKERMHLTLRRLMSYIYGAPILDVSRSHTTTQHSR